MARGRKKGGIPINSINDREELTNMIINQINSLNKKIKAFKKEDIDEHLDYIKQLISQDMGRFTPSDTLSKSKQFYGEKNTVWLKKTLSALVKINNHEFYGTTRKYKKEMTVQMRGVKAYAEGYLRKKGYDDNFIREVTSSKNFYVQLFDAFGENSKHYGSDQIIEKIALSYGNETGFSNEEKDKILNNIEYANNVKNRIREEQQAFEEFQRMRNGKKR